MYVYSFNIHIDVCIHVYIADVMERENLQKYCVCLTYFVSLRGWILKPVHQASHPWLPTSALQGASHPVSNQHNGAPRVPMSTDPVEAVTHKGHQVTMGLLSQDPKWLTTHMCWHAKQCRKCICRMHNLLFNHYATHWGWVKHLTSSIIFMI